MSGFEQGEPEWSEFTDAADYCEEQGGLWGPVAWLLRRSWALDNQEFAGLVQGGVHPEAARTVIETETTHVVMEDLSDRLLALKSNGIKLVFGNGE